MRSWKIQEGDVTLCSSYVSVAMIKKQLEKGRVCFGLKFHKKSPYSGWGGMAFDGQSRMLRDHILTTGRKQSSLEVEQVYKPSTSFPSDVLSPAAFMS